MYRSPEDPPSSVETDVLSQLLSGMDELATVSSYSGTQYATETLERMKQGGIEVNSFTMAAVLRRAFGDPEQALSRMQGCHSQEELEEMFPGEIGEAIVAYVDHLLDNA